MGARPLFAQRRVVCQLHSLCFVVAVRALTLWSTGPAGTCFDLRSASRRRAGYLERWASPRGSGTLTSMNRAFVAEILELPVDERMRLVEVIWDSISAAPESLPLTDWQRDELDRRLAEYEADPASGSSMEEVFARLRRGK